MAGLHVSSLSDCHEEASRLIQICTLNGHAAKA